MCGFAGAISYDRARPLSAAVADRVAELYLDGLAHRGPDGSGAWTHGLDAEPSPASPAIVLAHRRLAVIDPRPRSGQPFASRDGRLVLAFNGEIFNYRALRDELSTGGRVWQTGGDTEVLLAAYEAWGERCVERLDGMFAFAVVDRRDAEPTVFLARDPAGEKPLFYAMCKRSGGGTLLFSSELRPLRKVAATLGWADLRVDGDALREYLAWGYVPGELTIHAGVRKLRPGTCLTIGPCGATPRRYFDAAGRFEPGGPGRFQSVVTRARELVAAAVEKRLVSDVPIGCLLSGGVDSSVVALHMRRALGPNVETFSVGFDGVGEAKYDESKYAAEVARHLGCRHHSFRISAGTIDAAGDLERLATSFGEPFADSSALPTRLLSERVRRHVTVALGGDGGDELFGGYDRYRALQLSQQLGRLPLAGAAAGLAGFAGSKLGGRLGEKSRARRLLRLLATIDDAPSARYASYLRLFSREQLRWLTPAGGGGLNVSLVTRDDEGRVGGRWFEGFLRGDGQLASVAAAIDRSTYLPGDLLVKVDRASMLHALEVRSPMVDADLIRFAATLGDAELIDRRGGKRVLRAAFAKALPASVFNRRKQGFAVPIASWLRGPLGAMTRELLVEKNAFARSWFDGGAISLMLADHAEGRRDHGHRLFALLMLELWWRDAREDVVSSGKSA